MQDNKMMNKLDNFGTLLRMREERV